MHVCINVVPYFLSWWFCGLYLLSMLTCWFFVLQVQPTFIHFYPCTIHFRGSSRIWGKSHRSHVLRHFKKVDLSTSPQSESQFLFCKIDDLLDTTNDKTIQIKYQECLVFLLKRFFLSDMDPRSLKVLRFLLGDCIFIMVLLSNRTLSDDDFLS